MNVMELTIVHGDTTVINGHATLNGGAVNLTGCSLWFTVKNAVTDTDAAAVFQLTSPASGITIASGPAGRFQITIAPAYTSGLPYVVIPLVYDLQMKDVSGNVSTLISGALTVVPDVTRA